MNPDNPLKTDAIKRFLTIKTHPDLAALYNKSMEVQVHVTQDGGEPVEGDFQGRTWRAWRDDAGNTWKSFRIPLDAKTDPKDNDGPMKYSLDDHAEGIGMTGWDWTARKSRWVGFDFDAISGHADAHAKKLSDKELAEVQERACAIPWVTVRKSTSGKGLHLYVFVDVPTNNHTEHAALARAILGLMSGRVGYDFHVKVDAMGHIMWTWHRKMRGTDGLTLIKQGEQLDEIPPNWRDHIKVIEGKRRKNLPKFVRDNIAPLIGSEDEAERSFEELCGQSSIIQLDLDHHKFIDYLDNNHCYYWWDNDHHMLVTHTIHLKEAHEALGLKGPYDTISTGRERGADNNCFSGDSELLTDKGPMTFREAARLGTVKGYVRTNTGFQWMTFEVKSFGYQKTIPIYFGDNSSVRATAGHQWLYQDQNTQRVNLANRKATHELVPDKTQLPLSPIDLPEIDWEGYAHGFVYGDGWEVQERWDRPAVEHCDVALFGPKVALKKLLLKYGTLGSQCYPGSGYVAVIRNLPYHWKQLPKNMTKGYALGFVLGLCSADGDVHTSARIFQSDPLALKSIQDMAIYAGLRVFGVRPYGEAGSGYVNGRQGFCFRFNTYNLTEDHFLRSDQKTLFNQRQKNQTTTVSSIGWDLVEREEVFCAVVPMWQNFTLANGVNTGNCFMYPMRRGAWVVRRYGPGVAEHSTWEQDSSGYTRCFFNREPDLPVVARSQGATEHKNGGYVFQHAAQAQAAALELGGNLDLPTWATARTAKLTARKTDGKIVAEVKHESSDNGGDMVPKGWYHEGKNWVKVLNAQSLAPVNSEIGNYDDVVRHVTTGIDDAGWVLRSDEIWRNEPIKHITPALQSYGLNPKEAQLVVGSSVFKPWNLVNLPFQPEYPGDRSWNRNAAQFRYHPTTNTDALNYPYWQKVLTHAGQGLDEAIRDNPWCKINGIRTGADYLLLWIASMVQYPQEQLPYLFFYSEEQNTGKSIVHEALTTLFTCGVVRADAALMSEGAFNGELENAILCVIEETDLRKNKNAYNRIKDWVNSKKLPIHRKNQTPYDIINTTHWMHASNDRLGIPVGFGDSRITMIRVQPLDPTELIPKTELLALLAKEGPDFTAAIRALDIPPSNDRLNVPVIKTTEKRALEEATLTPLQVFLKDFAFCIPGAYVTVSEFHDKFTEWLDPIFIPEYSKIRVGKELPPTFPKGKLKLPSGLAVCYGNMSFDPDTKPGTRLIESANGDYLVGAMK